MYKKNNYTISRTGVSAYVLSGMILGLCFGTVTAAAANGDAGKQTTGLIFILVCVR